MISLCSIVAIADSPNLFTPVPGLKYNKYDSSKALSVSPSDLPVVTAHYRVVEKCFDAVVANSHGPRGGKNSRAYPSSECQHTINIASQNDGTYCDLLAVVDCRWLSQFKSLVSLLQNPNEILA
jgi:hypothetical protein